jgi:hypothetical protein
VLTVRRIDPDRLSDVCDRRCANALSVAHSMLPTHTIVNVCDAFHSDFQSVAPRRNAIRSVPDTAGKYKSTGDDASVANLRSAVLTVATSASAALSLVAHSLWKTSSARLQSAGAAFRIVL